VSEPVPLARIGILAIMREFLSWTAATGHGPDDYPRKPMKLLDWERDLLDSMPYRLTVNGVMKMRGTLQEVQAAVADVVTTRLALAPEQIAPEAQEIRGAFAEGDVERALNERGQWFTMLDALSDNPLRIKVTKETEGE
jgi:hypothetical protein